MEEVEETGRSQIGRIVGLGQDESVVEGESDLGSTGTMGDASRQTVGEELMVDGGQCIEEERPAGGELTDGISLECGGRRFVDRQPRLHTISDSGRYRFDVLRETEGRVTVQPPADVVERRRHVPMAESWRWRDPGLEKRVEETLVVVEPTGVGRRGRATVGNDPGPRE